MSDVKKFLDYEGVKLLWSKINMNDYPNNETLMAVINAIDETKADKDYIDEIFNLYLLNIDYDNTLAFDTSEIVIGEITNTAMLGRAILGKMILGS